MLEQIIELQEQPYTEADEEWDAFVTAHPQGSFLQTTQWARLKSRFGWHSNRVWMRKEGQLVAGAQVLYRSAYMGAFKMGYVPHGPLVNWEDGEQVSVLLNQIDHSAYENGAGLLKMEPLLWEGQDISPAGWQALSTEHNNQLDTDTIQPPRTVLVDLRPDEEAILAAMKQKTRYNIRLSGRKDITIREGTLEDIPAFNKLMRETGERDGFGVHAGRYYQVVFELFAPQELAMLIAEYEGQPLAALMVTAIGKQAVYLYGASSNVERQRMPTYALQWAAMQWAKAKGCEFYDLWGVPDQPETELEAHFKERRDGLWGVYRNKRGYGGQVQRTVGAADRVYNNTLYRLYKWRRARKSTS